VVKYTCILAFVSLETIFK